MVNDSAERFSEGWYLKRLAESAVPEHMHAGIVRYLVHGLPPGHFYRAVLENDLREAFLRGDSENSRHLHDHVAFLYSSAPAGAWGSPIEVADWIEFKRKQRDAEAVDKPRAAL